MDALHWNADALRVQLEPWLPGLAVEVVESTGSTNTDLVDRVRAGILAAGDAAPVQLRRSVESRAFTAAAAPFAPCLRVAERQTDGRGRQGRTWLAERGTSLTFSLALELDAADWSGLSLAVGVALAEAIDPVGSSRRGVALKWPNDLWLVDGGGTGRKLGGVLIETVPAGGRRVAVIGVGLNLRPIDAARSAVLSSGYACAQEIEPGLDAPALLARVAPPLAAALRLFERSGFAPFAARYASRDLLFGRPVRTTSPDAPEGIAAGVDAQGALVVRTSEGAAKAVSSGEVSVRLDGTVPSAAPSTAS